ncbi:hypothetical protein [Streptomyces sp. NPDC048386]
MKESAAVRRFGRHQDSAVLPAPATVLPARATVRPGKAESRLG